MNLGDHARIDAEPRARPFQFSLRTMFIVTTVVAVWCGGLFAPYALARYLTLTLWMLSVPVVLLVMVIYARGPLRTFAIGGLTTTLPLVFCHIVLAYVIIAGASVALSSGTSDWSGFNVNDDSAESRFGPGVFCAVYTAVIFLFGFLAIGIRWIVEPSRQTRISQVLVEPPLNVGVSGVEGTRQESENTAV